MRSFLKSATNANEQSRPDYKEPICIAYAGHSDTSVGASWWEASILLGVFHPRNIQSTHPQARIIIVSLGGA
jgi:hypothetical protein